MSELQSFLADLGGGKGDEGTFTLNYAKALRQLRRYQLQDRYHALNCLVMSAVAAGACNAEFTLGRERPTHSFRHDGCCPQPEQLRHLFANLLSGEESLRYLAIALNCSLTDDRSVAELTTPGGRFVFRLEELARHDVSSEAFHLEISGFHEERVLDAVRKAASYAPLALRFESSLLNAPTRLPAEETVAYLRLYDPGPAGDHFVVAPRFSRGKEWTELSSRAQLKGSEAAARVELVEGLEAVHCAALVCLFEKPQRPTEIQLFRHGVRIENKLLSHHSGALIMLGTEGLQIDLTSHQVVENADFHELVHWATQQVDRLSARLRKAYPFLGLQERLEAARFGY